MRLGETFGCAVIFVSSNVLDDGASREMQERSSV